MAGKYDIMDALGPGVDDLPPEFWENYKVVDEAGDWQEHPLFSDATTIEDAEKTGTKYMDDLASMKKREKETPLDRAEDFKEEGNACLKAGKKYWDEAFGNYTRAILEKCGSDHHQSIYHSNRAQVSLVKHNYGKALLDAKMAIKLNPANIKAQYRAAKALLMLKKYKESLNHCDEGLKLDDANEGLLDIKKKASAAWSEQEKEKKMKEIERMREEAQTRSFHAQCKKRGYKIGPDAYGVWADSGMSISKIDSSFLWPTLFIYPESQQSDGLAEFDENDTIEEQLQRILPDSGPPAPWDSEFKYRASTVEVYYLSFCVKPLPPFRDGIQYKQPRWVRVNKKEKLSQVLSRPDFVIPQYPVFHVLVPNTNYHEAFFKESVGGWWNEK